MAKATKKSTKEVAVVVADPKIKELAVKSGLELTKAEEHASKFHSPLARLAECSRALAGLNKTNPTKEDVKIAHENRMAIVKIRGEIVDIKDDLKKTALVEANYIQSLHNFGVDACKLTEQQYQEIEKFAERQERERKDKLAAEREALLLPYEVDTTFLPLTELDDAQFQTLLDNSKILFDAKAETARQNKIKEEAAALIDERKTALLNAGTKLEEGRFVYGNSDISLEGLDRVSPTLFDETIVHVKKWAADEQTRKDTELAIANRTSMRITQLSGLGMQFDFETTAYNGHNFTVEPASIEATEPEQWSKLIESIKEAKLTAEQQLQKTRDTYFVSAVKDLKGIGLNVNSIEDETISNAALKFSVHYNQFNALNNDEEYSSFIEAVKTRFENLTLKAQQEKIAADAAAETKRKAEAAALLNKAPDQDKFKAWYASIKELKAPELTSAAGKEAMKEIDAAFAVLRTAIITSAKKLV